MKTMIKRSQVTDQLLVTHKVLLKAKARNQVLFD